MIKTLFIALAMTSPALAFPSLATQCSVPCTGSSTTDADHNNFPGCESSLTITVIYAPGRCKGVIDVEEEPPVIHCVQKRGCTSTVITKVSSPRPGTPVEICVWDQATLTWFCVNPTPMTDAQGELEETQTRTEACGGAPGIFKASHLAWTNNVNANGVCGACPQ